MSYDHRQQNSPKSVFLRTPVSRFHGYNLYSQHDTKGDDAQSPDDVSDVGSNKPLAVHVTCVHAFFTHV